MMKRPWDSMIKLKNFEKNNSVIRCEIYPEESEIPGYLFFDVIKGCIVDYKLPAGYEWCKKHIFHARDYLIKAGSTDLPNEKLIMWG